MTVLDEIRQIVVRLDIELQETRKDVRKLLRMVVDGNGKPGLTTRVELLESHRAPSGPRWRVVAAVVTALGAVVAAALSLLRFL